MKSLHENVFFNNVPREIVEPLSSLGAPLSIAKGQAVFKEGDPGNSMYLILSGRVRIAKTSSEGTEEILTELQEGDYFGEMSIIDQEPRSAHAVALMPLQLWELHEKKFDYILIAHPQIPINLFRNISSRLRNLNDHFVAEIVKRERLAVVGRMANSIIHDFKNPLATIRLSGELLETEQSPHVQKFSRMILRQVDRLMGMTRDLLDFSRGQTLLNKREVRISEIMNEFLELVDEEYQSRRIEVEKALNFDEQVLVDPDKMVRVFYNICGNAVDAMSGGGRLKLQTEKSGTSWRLSIADTGPGIPDEIRNTLFVPFVTHGKKNGTGLGMAVTKKIVEDHGGKIWFDTFPQKGTTFHIEMPFG